MPVFPRRSETPIAVRAAQLRAQAAARARRARRQLVLLTPLLVSVLVLYRFRIQIFGADKPVRIATVVVLVIVGWAFARGLGRALRPMLDRRLDLGTAGVVGFLVRLATLGLVVIVALRIAGLKPGTLTLGASFTAIVLGLAAQQTFGNILAGVVLLSARPFSVGDRVELKGFGFDVQGTVTSLGLLYVTLTDGEDLILVPNNTTLTMSVRPLRQPSAVDMLARLPPGTAPFDVEERIVEALTVATRERPIVALEEYDGARVTVRVTATPLDRHEGSRLAGEVLDALEGLAGDVRQVGATGAPSDRDGSP